jgi:hypothetical protein
MRARLAATNCCSVTTMKITPVRIFLFAGALCALVCTLRAQVVELRATVDQSQENPATGSPARGSAIMLYDVAANTFDLVISISGLTNTATGSHIHEAPAGSNGPVKTDLGGEARYTRNGNTLTATFRDVKNLGDPVKLLQGGAYYNIHSAQFPGGEIRGQLIPQPVRMYAVMDVAQEAAAFPNTNFAGVNDFGGAVMVYDPMTNVMRLRLSVFNMSNVLNNSHFHAEAPGKSGPVVVNLPNNVNAAGYSNAGGYLSGTFDLPMATPGVTNPVTLLTGGMYLNFHSTTFGSGEVRGQVLASQETPGTRFANLSVRGFVGTGEQVLIQGITVNGPEPIRALISAKGPSLSAFGVTGALANPRLQLFDSSRRLIATNDDFGAVAAGSELASIPGLPTNTLESALVLVLPPGNYTAVVSSSTGATGVALLEVSDLRNLGGTVVPASTRSELITLQRAGMPAKPSSAATVAQAAIELCITPIATTLAQR